MRYFVVAAIFSLFAQFGTLSGSRDLNQDPRLKKEVEDFEEFLRQKIEKESISQGSFHLEQSLRTSDKVHDQRDYSVDDSRGGADSEKFGSLMEELSQNVPYSDEHFQSSVKEVSSRESLDGLPSSGTAHSELPLEKQHRPVEEIIFIRRSDTESNDPIKDVIETLVHDSAAKDEIPSSRRHSSEHISALDTEDEPSSDDACLTDNYTSHLDQTCSDGPEYEMQFHPTFSETLKQDMEKMLPEKDPDANKCDYLKELTLDASVEDRALCPFEWSISNRNPSRVPEYLYEAKCSCQVSRILRGKRHECREVKRVIPVLWIAGCGPHKKKMYKQGWEEIAVACAPLEERDSNVVPNNRGPM